MRDRMSSTDWRLYYESKAKASRLKSEASALESSAAAMAGDTRAAEDYADLARAYAEDEGWNKARALEAA